MDYDEQFMKTKYTDPGFVGIKFCQEWFVAQTFYFSHLVATPISMNPFFR